MLLETVPTGRTWLDFDNLAGKVAVIIGGASGIGLALGKRLKAAGMQIVLADLDREALDRAADEVGAAGIVADIRIPESVQALADETLARFGKVDLLCSNAGVSRMSGVANLTREDWRWLFDVNLFGAVNALEAFLPLLKANPDGAHILFTASLSSFYPTRSQAAYGASKYALAALGETLAIELQADGDKVGVSLLCPGPVRTNIGTGYGKREAHYRTSGAEDATPDHHQQAFIGSATEADWASTAEIAEAAFQGMRRGEFWIITHPELMGAAIDRHRMIEEAAGRVVRP